MVEQLLQYAQAHEAAFVPTRVGPTGMRKIAENMRISRVLSDMGPWRDALEERFRAVMDDAAHALGLGAIDLAMVELELVAHGDGAFYTRHVDTSTTQINARSDRVLTGVYYFHRHPRGFSGGELRLHSIRPVEQGGQFVDIVPERDMLLLFPSWAPHEVRPISCPSGEFAHSRFAINCWYRQRRKSVAVSSPPAVVPAKLSVNALAALARGRDIDSAYLEVYAYTGASGFTRNLLRDGDPGFDDAVRLLAMSDDADATLADALPDAVRSLWAIGLLVAADQRTEIVPPEAFAAAHDSYAGNGFALFPDGLAAAVRQAALAHYRQAIANGSMHPGDRHTVLNDPVARILQRAMRAAVERIVGYPVRSSDICASLVCGGAELPVHADRARCQYTVSLLLDDAPMPDDGCSPWALMLQTHPDAPPVNCRQSVGEALLFRGCEAAHSRPPLQPDHGCWGLLLHYADADRSDIRNQPEPAVAAPRPADGIGCCGDGD